MLTSNTTAVSIGRRELDKVVTALSLVAEDDGLIVTKPDTAVILLGADDLGVGVDEGLAPVSAVADNTGDSEEDSEELRREAHGTVDQTRIKVDVGVELTRNEVLVSKGSVLEGNGNLNQGVTTDEGEDFLGNTLDDLGAGVEVAVDTVTEAEKLLLLVLNTLKELGDVLHAADTGKHTKHSLIGTTMEGAVEGTDGTGNSGVDIHTTAGQVTNSGRGAVHLVLGVENEHDIKSAGKLGVRAVVGRITTIEHVEEVLGIVKGLVRRSGSAASALMVGESSKSGDLGEKADNLLVLHVTVLVNTLTSNGGVGLRVEGAESADTSHESAHGMGVVGQGIDGVGDLNGQSRVAHNVLTEVGKLRLAGKVAEENEVSSLEHIGALGNLLNGITAVAENTLVTINVRNARNDGSGVGVSRVISAKTDTITAGLNLLEGLSIYGTTNGDLQLILLAGAVIGKGEGSRATTGSGALLILSGKLLRENIESRNSVASHFEI
mmetsp:Transcript_33628/g.60719  ORF Transcript_33628/g.60719 Transcript_33628/m.60719 type:complete len:493 (-) Transcript_33628:27-1505(-)